MWRIAFTKEAQRDAKKIAAAGFRSSVQTLLDILRYDPYKTPPAFTTLVGDLSGAYSRRINIQRRLVYQILDKEEVVKVIRLWTQDQDQSPIL